MNRLSCINTSKGEGYRTISPIEPFAGSSIFGNNSQKTVEVNVAASYVE